VKRYVLGLLGVLMVGHLALLSVAVDECRKRQDPGPVCQKIASDLQQGVEAYLAVLLALMARLDGDGPN
jgi:hypothetical protein